MTLGFSAFCPSPLEPESQPVSRTAKAREIAVRRTSIFFRFLVVLCGFDLYGDQTHTKRKKIKA
jgi:hypothetical protein